MRRACSASLVIGLSMLVGACSGTLPSSSQPNSSPAAAPPVPMSNNADANVPPHLTAFPGLSVRRGDDIVPAPEEDVQIASGYASAPDKGSWIAQRRITLLTARLRVRVGEPVRVIHVSETTRAGDQLYVMGPKPIRGEYVDGALRTAPAPASSDPLVPAGLYDGRVMPAPAADYNWDVTEYSFSSSGSHTIEWKLGALVSNQLMIDVTP
ncbi:MAG TPA: hypothetical protein VHT91_14010 [Kofleriaceae bacterium]|jgi:hypothetical protein|nr:hypothetical protein [Kofleriaceae bacterium]